MMSAIFIDASAIVAILNAEPGADDIVRRIDDHRTKRFVSPLVRFEAAAAVARFQSGPRKPTAEQLEQAEDVVNRFCDAVGALDVVITGGVAQIALAASRRYGEAVGHPAGLNFGDCFAYACAKAYHAKLIYKGDDFSQTDLR